MKRNDRIILYLRVSQGLRDLLQPHLATIQRDTLAQEVVFNEDIPDGVRMVNRVLGGEVIQIGLKRA